MRNRSVFATAVSTLFAMAAFAIGCARADSAPPDAGRADTSVDALTARSATDPNAAARPQFDVSRVIRGVHFAFRPDGTDFVGGHTTYGVRANERAFTVTSFHRPDPDAPASHGPDVRFATESILPEGVGARASTPTPRVESDGALSITRSENVTEQISNGDDGVEQSWTFATRPAGSGDLVVRVSVSGAPYAGDTERGVHFLDPSSGLGVRFGHGTWIDAQGRRTAVRARYENGAIVLAVPEQVVASAAYPAVLDPTISPEITFDTPTAYVRRTGVSPAIAFDGTNYLVVWSDLRNAGSGYELYGTRVRASDGVVLDRAGIAIYTATTDQLYPAVGYAAGNFLVAWNDHTSSSDSVLAIRVATDGSIVGAAIHAPATTLSQFGEQIACDTANCFLVWSDPRLSPRAIYGARIRMSDGVVLDSSNVLIATYPGSTAAAPGLAVSFDGSNYLVVWANNGGIGGGPITAARVRASDATLLDVSPIAISSSALFNPPSEPSVAFCNGVHVIAWTVSNHTLAARFDPSTATVMDPAGIAINSAESGRSLSPVVGCAGAQATVFYTNDGTSSTLLEARRMNVSTGAVVDASPFNVGSVNSGHGAAAYGGSTYLVAWVQASSIGGTIVGARMSPATGAVLDAPPIFLSNSVSGEATPAVATDGSTYFAVWRDLATSTVVGIRVRESDGALLDSHPITISNGLNPSVTYGAGNFYVTWQVSQPVTVNDVFGTRVRASDGVVLDPTGVAVCAATGDQTLPSVAFDGTDYFAVWNDSRGPAFGTRIHTSDGTPYSPSGQILSPSSVQNAQVACSSTQCFVIWTGASTGPSGTRIRASDGSVIDTTPIVVSTNSTTGARMGLATNGTNFYATYSVSGSGLYGRPILATGALGPENQLTSGLLGISPYSSAVAFDGNQYVATWLLQNLRAARVSATGTVIDTTPIVVETGAVLTGSVGAASSGLGRSLIVYLKNDTTYTYGTSNRARGRFFDNGRPNGVSCTAAADCGSLQCVDGVCCNSACGGGAISDCQACSVSAGAAMDGTCGPVVDATHTCRAASGICDAPETCDGVSLVCPVDRGTAPGAECRPSLGPCDPAETCNGSPTCPADATLPPGTVCRVAAGACDVAELCGSGPACPPDTRLTAGTVCRSAAGACDVAEACDGSNAACPSDQVSAAGTTCRAAVSMCDVAEVCDGSSRACPTDVVASAGSVVCRPAAGPCDLSESCDGVRASCPPDVLQASTFTCRAPSNACDTAERCDGTTAACPIDRSQPDGTPCDDSLQCNGHEACTAGACVPGVAPDCSDGLACTMDVCGEPSGCMHLPIASCMEPDAGTPDAATDSGASDAATDASTSDGGGDSSASDVVTDSPPVTDAGVDTAVDDAAMDSGDDVAATDSGADAVIDSGVSDVAVDSTPGNDGGTDSAPATDVASVTDATADAQSRADVSGDSASAIDATADAGPAGRSAGCGCRVPASSGSRGSGIAIIGLATAFASVASSRRRRSKRGLT